MMRKLVVTVFALSFAALGCGSDSGTPSSVDTGTTNPGIDSGAKKDTSAADAFVTPDVTASSLDTAKTDDVATTSDDVAVSNDTNTQGDVAPAVDASAQTDVILPVLDGAKPSVDSGETQKPVDSGASVDSGKVESAVDGGVLDGGSIG